MAYVYLLLLQYCYALSADILTNNNEQTLRNLGINLTCGDRFLKESVFEL